ncbi:sulfurtransferase TusA family protein [Alloalcanivorax sp. C16-1]|uniref:sulfurtransferase TusA family protein n=1 Tax=Alloalcanivorax sp. C16-1 TaxID=3390051 RepID=UPI003970D092
MTDTIHDLDVRRQLCPIPVIKTQNRVNQLARGEVLRVTCTDPGALNDIPAWCRINGHEVLETRREDHEVVITLKVGEPSVAL